MGELAAGVADEVNAPLSSLSKNLELTRDRLARLEKQLAVLASPSGERAEESAASLAEEVATVRQAVDEACSLTGRVARVMHELRAFSRSRDEAIGDVDLRAAIDTSIELLRDAIRSRARLVVECVDAPTVRGNAARLGEVFVTLLANAVDAIGDADLEANRITLSVTDALDDWICIEVRDTGVGMSAATLERAVEPFFTTKNAEDRVGLGLTICQSIVSSYDGLLTIESTEGKGTAVRVLLRRAERRRRKSTPRRPVALGRKLRVLVVDDEPLVTRAMARWLAAAHEVESVRSTDEARAKLRAGALFDVVFCDMTILGGDASYVSARLESSFGEHAGSVVLMVANRIAPGVATLLETLELPTVDKPVKRPELELAIDRVMRRRSKGLPA